MKIRNGFVSNSSSSSFIIAYKEDKTPCPHCGRSDTEIERIKELFNSAEDDDSSWRTSSYDEVMNEIKDYFDPSSAQLKDIIAEINTYAEQGYEVAMVDISYHNEALNHIITNNKNIKVIKDLG